MHGKPIKTMRDVRKPVKKRLIYPELINEKGPDNWLGFKIEFHPEFLKSIKRSGIIIAGSASLYIILIGFLAHSAFGEVRNIQSEIPAIQASAEKLNTGDIASRLGKIYQSLSNISATLRYSGMTALTKAAGLFSPTIGAIPAIISDTLSLNGKTVLVAEDLDLLKSEGINMLLSGNGNQLIETLARLKNNLSEISELNRQIAKDSKKISLQSGGLASAINAFMAKSSPAADKLVETRDFLDSFIDFLRQPEDQHILLMFQNPTEMRPAGGFIGSFGVLTINRGNLKEIKIDDIYNADRQLDLKLLPPKELRGITPTWGARDANWFFDFPTSARKVISLLEESNLFKPKNIRFQAAVAINTNVLGSIIKAAGPITLEKYNLTIDSGNFLKEIQREVEQGQDKKPGQNPKRILSALAPILMEKFSRLDSDEKAGLASDIKDHLLAKDIMIYSENWRIQSFLENLEIAGDVMGIPDDFSGDYLAVVNANIAGGKTDAVTSQHISVKSSISSIGEITNQVSISRTHSGEEESDWWYAVPNKNYLKLLVPENSKLLSIEGNDRIITKSDSAYAKNLKYDADLAAIEKTAVALENLKMIVGKEFGKTSFGAWLTTLPGKSKTFVAQYRSGRDFKIRSNATFEFIFEKQSGADGSLEYSVAAPPGYLWKESGKSLFEYGTQQIKGRERLKLTLVKI